jgi:hypothetical protein
MVAVAIKKGQSREKARGLQQRGTLRCYGCGEEFVVNHEPSIVNKRLAERQASWLERVLADDHHANAIRSIPTGSNCRTNRRVTFGANFCPIFPVQ